MVAHSGASASEARSGEAGWFDKTKSDEVFFSVENLWAPGKVSNSGVSLETVAHSGASAFEAHR